MISVGTSSKMANNRTNAATSSTSSDADCEYTTLLSINYSVLLKSVKLRIKTIMVPI